MLQNEPFEKLTLDELLVKMRSFEVGDRRLDELNAELARRVVVSQMNASDAQVRSAWFQLSAVIAMFATTSVTAFFQWLAWAYPH